MNEVVSGLPGGVATIAGGLLVAVAALAAYIPKLLNTMKVDRQESEALKRIDKLEKQYAEQADINFALKRNFGDALNLLIGIRMWLEGEGHTMPDHLKDAFDDLIPKKPKPKE
jgi:hypothetical protein